MMPTRRRSDRKKLRGWHIALIPVTLEGLQTGVPMLQGAIPGWAYIVFVVIVALLPGVIE